MDIETQVIFHQKQLQALPQLESKGKVKLKLSPEGNLDIEASSLSQTEVKGITDFALMINADNAMRSRMVNSTIKSSEEVFTHLIAISLVSFFLLSGYCIVSKIFVSSKPIGEVVLKWQNT